jgi:aldose 1-epimerase
MSIKQYKLSNNNGVTIDFISLGARITSVKIPHKDSHVDIALGYDTLEETINGDGYMGAICGRLANRVDNGKFILEGKEYILDQNERTNHIHGGAHGYNNKIWEVKESKLEGYESAYELSYLSVDGEGGYPGNLHLTIIYALNNDNEFLIDIKGVTDKTTVVNLTSHPYFNLNGLGGGKIFNHGLEINANSFTPINEMGIPTGEIRSVANTDMEFIQETKLSRLIKCEYDQINLVGGLDHNWVINESNEALKFACKVSEPESGRSIEVFTTQPGIQIYTGMHFDGTNVGKSNIPLTQYAGIAIEAQNFPDAVNHENFPSAVLKPNETYKEKIIYKFGF